MRLPRSIKGPQRYLIWAFPLLLAYGAVKLPGARTDAKVAVVVLMFAVFTGWLSDPVLPEELYNDALLLIDVALLVVYWLLLYNAARWGYASGQHELATWYLSGLAFALYAAWDGIALLMNQFGQEWATTRHLRRFAIVTGAIACVFFAGGAIADRPWRAIAAAPDKAVASHWLDSALLVIWALVLLWWHWSRVRAAIVDSAETA